MGKGKKKKDSELPKVSSNNKTVTGTLEHSGIEIKISVKKPEDWAMLRNFYNVFKRDFYKDCFPLMQSGARKSFYKGKNELHEGHKYFLNAIRVLSSVLYAYDTRERSRSLEFHLGTKSIKKTRDYIASSSLGGWVRHHKIVHFLSDRYNLKSFYNDYIQKGNQIIKSDRKSAEKYLSTIKSILSPRIQELSHLDKKIQNILGNKSFLNKP